MARRAEAGWPLRVVTMDASTIGPISADRPGGGRYAAAWVLVTREGSPIGSVEVGFGQDGQVDVRELADLIAALPAAPARDEPSPSANVLLSISVVIPTNLCRPGSLRETLASIAAANYPDVDVVIVDNRPVGGAAPLPEILADFPFARWVHAERGGVAAARNAGVATARGEIIAFTDDDVVVDPGWLFALGRRFAAHPEEDAVTGLVIPRELETPAQVWFESYYGGFAAKRSYRSMSFASTIAPDGRRLRSRVTATDDQGRRGGTFSVYGAGVIGAGANMAFRTATLERIGGFDPHLGASPPALAGGEDIAALVTLLWLGGRIGYEPAAMVWHRHRSDISDLRRQLHGYGAGYTAALASLTRGDRAHLGEIARQLPAAAKRQLREARARRDGSAHAPPAALRAGRYPTVLRVLELSGYLRGPGIYLARARRAERPTGWPIRVEIVEASRVPEITNERPDGGRYVGAWVVVLREGYPCGTLEVGFGADGRVDPDALKARIAALPGRAEIPEPDTLPSISVVIATNLGRPAGLQRTLTSLAAADYPDLEIVVVDNRPVGGGDPLPEILSEHPDVVVVLEPRPGPPAARNTGVAAARGEIVAFTDDDVIVDSAWLRALGRRFANCPDEDAVTGLIVPAELETQAQVWFERYYGGFAAERSFESLSFASQVRPDGRRVRSSVAATDTHSQVTRTFPVYGAGAIGAGANMAFRTEALKRIGGFDPALGAGTPARGGGDIAAFMTLLWEGGRIGYEPGAMVLHRHRRAETDLRRQLHNYGIGYIAGLASLVRHDPGHLLGLARELPVSVRGHLRRAGERRGAEPAPVSPSARPFPSYLRVVELSGYFRGVSRYVTSVRKARRWSG